MTSPPMMRAARSERAGGPDVLALRAIATPTPGVGEVLVRVRAAGLNPKDRLLRARRTSPRRGSRGTGFDFAGEVVGHGARVSDPPIGARVLGFLDGLDGGTAAEFVCVHRDWLVAMPAPLPWVDAAAAPLVASTALQALRDVARLVRGEHVLIKGATGGVGTAAIQLARRMGAHVTVVAAEADAAHVRAFGADDVLPAERPPWRDAHRRYDVFLDCAGGSRLRAFLPLLARGGRWVSVAPDVAVFALAPLSALLAPLVGGPRFGYVVVRPRRADLEAIVDLVAAGQLRIPVATVHPLEGIADAHRALDRRGARGKHVVLIDADAGR